MEEQDCFEETIIEAQEQTEWERRAERFKGKDIWTLNHEAKGGEDTIHFNLCVNWGPSFFGHLQYIEELKNLAKAKYAQKDGQENPDDSPDSEWNGAEEEEDFTPKNTYDTIPAMSIENHCFHVLPYGQNTGETKYSYYPIVMEENGIRFLLTKRTLTQTQNSGNVRVLIGSLPLMKWGAETCIDSVCSAISVLGGNIISCTLSRVDLCVDLPGIRIDDMQRAIENSRFVCRGKNKSNHYLNEGTSIQTNRAGLKRTGFSIGKSNIVFRAYDKIEESRFNEDKRIVLIQNRWNDELPENATRCEFELKREGLRKFCLPGVCESIRTWEDYLKCRSHIAEYLVTEWLRLYSKRFDHAHTERLSDFDLLPAWKMVADTFREVYSEESGRGKIQVTKEQPKPERQRLKQQATGCMLSALAAKGIKFFENKKELFLAIAEEIKNTIKSYDMNELRTRIFRKAARHEGRTPTPNETKSYNIPW